MNNAAGNSHKNFVLRSSSTSKLGRTSPLKQATVKVYSTDLEKELKRRDFVQGKEINHRQSVNGSKVLSKSRSPSAKKDSRNSQQKVLLSRKSLDIRLVYQGKIPKKPLENKNRPNIPFLSDKLPLSSHKKETNTQQVSSNNEITMNPSLVNIRKRAFTPIRLSYSPVKNAKSQTIPSRVPMKPQDSSKSHTVHIMNRPSSQQTSKSLKVIPEVNSFKFTTPQKPRKAYRSKSIEPMSALLSSHDKLSLSKSYIKTESNLDERYEGKKFLIDPKLSRVERGKFSPSPDRKAFKRTPIHILNKKFKMLMVIFFYTKYNLKEKFEDQRLRG